MLVMAETTTNTTSKPKPKPVAISAPTFEMPKFEMPKMEVPAPFREFAEKGVAQARENYEKMKSTAEDATKVLEDSYATASQGCSGYGLKLIETARTNSNATFDMLTQLMGVKSFSEGVELYTGFLREQFDIITAQTKELTDHAQKVATDTAEPIKASVSSAISKAA